MRTHGEARGAAQRTAVAVLACLVLVASPAIARAGQQCDGSVCLSWPDGEEEVPFAIEHSLPVPIYVRLRFSELENADASPEREPHALVAPTGRVDLAQLRRRDPSRSFRYRFEWSFTVGDPNARHDPSARYQTPFGGSAPRELTQGPNGAFSHRGEHAFDFVMPVGTPVLAARAGVVAWVVDRYDRGGRQKSLADQTNEVVVAHADGSLARYLHLRRGIAVAVGDAVEAGALLGHSGNTGYSTRPHLHFEVRIAGGPGEPSTVPIRFVSDDPRGFEPVAGSFYPPQSARSAASSPTPRREDQAASR